MDTKKNLKVLWEYLTDAFELEEIDEAIQDHVEGFGYEAAQINTDLIDSLSEDDARSLLFDTGYMAVNGLFGGDWGTWGEVLESLGFDEETIDFMDF